MSLSEFFERLDLWVLVWCALLFASFLGALLLMVLQSRRVVAAIRRAAGAFQALSPDRGEDRRSGRSLDAFERVQAAAETLGSEHAHWWAHVDDALEKYESPDGREGYFVTRPVDDLVTTEDLTRGYSWSAYHALPGVLTSLGLLGTFIAILLGFV